MPTILRSGGVRLFFYSNEGNPLEPVHVHVRHAEKLAKFWVEPAVSLAENFGFTSSELRDLEALVYENIDLIKGRWNAHFGS